MYIVIIFKKTTCYKVIEFQTLLCELDFSAISEAVTRSCSRKKMLFNILQNPKENSLPESLFNKVAGLQ